MGRFYEGRELSRNSERQNYALNQSTPTGSSSHDETFPCTNSLEGQREPIPSMDKPLEA